jgi:hypothetical protein
MSVEFGVVAKAIERLAPPPFSPLATSLCGVEECDLRWSSPAGDLVTTLGRQILKSNGLASSYSQFKWKFSIKTTQPKTLKIVEPNSQAMMAPDRRRGQSQTSQRSRHCRSRIHLPWCWTLALTSLTTRREGLRTGATSLQRPRWCDRCSGSVQAPGRRRRQLWVAHKPRLSSRACCNEVPRSNPRVAICAS